VSRSVVHGRKVPRTSLFPLLAPLPHQRHPLVERLARFDDEGDAVPPLVTDREPTSCIGRLPEGRRTNDGGNALKFGWI